MPKAKAAAKPVSKKAAKKVSKRLAKEALVVEVRKIRPQLIAASSSLTRVLGMKPLAKADKKFSKRMKSARKAIEKVVAQLGK